MVDEPAQIFRAPFAARFRRDNDGKNKDLKCFLEDILKLSSILHTYVLIVETYGM